MVHIDIWRLPIVSTSLKLEAGERTTLRTLNWMQQQVVDMGLDWRALCGEIDKYARGGGGTYILVALILSLTLTPFERKHCIMPIPRWFAA